MSAINLQIDFVDGTATEVTVVAIDQIKFESNFNISISKLGQEMMLTHLYWLAWHVQKRTGKTALDFEQWAETVDSVGVGDSPK